MLVSHLKEVADDLLSLLYMDLCISCYEIEPISTSPFCLSCIADIPYIDQQSSIASLLIGKPSIPKEIANIYSLLTYAKSGKVKQLMHQLKYGGRAMIGVKLGEQLGRHFKMNEGTSHYQLIPVPLHPKRFRKRGYNQSNKIAEGIKNITKIEINPHVLKRIQNNESQTQMAVQERGEIHEKRFALNEQAKSDTSKHIILVDDIITTGSTIAACYNLLKKKGYHKISVATLAITI